MDTIQNILADPITFLEKVDNALSADDVNVLEYEIDHICYRVETGKRYLELKTKLLKIADLYHESLVNGRPIAIYKLNKAIKFDHRKIKYVELASPKKKNKYKEGFEHIEFVIDCSFDEFMKKHPRIIFNTKHLKKESNPDIRIQYDSYSVKFHHQSLVYIIDQEKENK